MTITMCQMKLRRNEAHETKFPLGNDNYGEQLRQPKKKGTLWR